MKTILTGMVSDLFHVGHLNLIERASEYGKLIVCVPTSEGAYRAKGKRPIIDFEGRLRIINALKCVYMTIGFFDNDHLDKIIETIRPDMFIRGDDWSDFPGRKKLEELKIPIKFLKYTEGISSTKIKEDIYAEFIRSKKDSK
jgi:cytidyltransferase-like protein